MPEGEGGSFNSGCRAMPALSTLPSHASEGGKEGDSSKPINRWGHPMPPKVARRGRAKQEVGGLVFIDYPIMLYSL